MITHDRIKLLILDFDGTIGDTQTLITNTMLKTIERLHLPSRTREQCTAMIGLPLKQTFTKLIDMTDEMGDLCAETYRKIFEENNKPGFVPLFPNVIETLKKLYKSGITLTIASSRSNVTLLKFVKDLQLEEYITLVISCDDIKHPKPHPEMVSHILEATGFKASETLVVGDAKYDIMMGKAAGCPTVGVTYGNGGRREMEEENADYIIDDFAQLIDIVSNNTPKL